MRLFEHVPHPHQPRNMAHVHKQEIETAGFNQRLAVLITKAFGSIWAFYALIAWMVLWMVLASAGVWLFARDSYPFPFLLFCSNLVQLWALPVLAVGQAVLSRKSELMAEEQFRTTQRSYYDIEQIVSHLNAQDAELLKQTQLLTRLVQELLDKQARSF